MLAGLDRRGGITDDLGIFDQGFSRLYRHCCHFVTCRHVIQKDDAFDVFARAEAPNCSDDIVGRIKPDIGFGHIKHAALLQ